MRILVVGGRGTVGRAALAGLKRHEVVVAGRSGGDLRVDIADEGSIAAMYAALGRVDAVVSTAGEAHFGPLATMTAKDFRKGLDSKLLGQVSLVLLGQHVIADGGSFTLTSGVTNRDVIRGGANAAAVNGGIDDFVKSAAIELPRGIRINAVSPGVLEESAVAYDGYFPGHEPVTSARVGLAFAKAVEGGLTGQVICVG